MRLWYVQFVDKEFRDALADPYDPMLKTMARDGLEAKGYELSGDDPILSWEEIPFDHDDLRKGDWILRVGFKDRDHNEHHMPHMPEPPESLSPK